MESVVKIDGLCKSFGDVRAVQDLSFEVRRGELFAFLGVNGAGKSTTISVICGLLKKDSGSVTVCGENADSDMKKIAGKIGVVFQNSVLDKSLTVKDNLQSRAALYGITGKQFTARLKELADMLDFGDILNRTVGKLSGGQRRRIDIARALLHSPELLILDEPTTGLDPQTRRMLWNVVKQLRQDKNMTVLLTTHYMEEAVDADYIIIIDSGKISANGTPLEMKNKYTGDFITLYNTDEQQVRELGLPYENLRDGVRISVNSTEQATQLILKNPELFKDYEIVKGKMDDVFLAVTGKTLTGGENK